MGCPRTCGRKVKSDWRWFARSEAEAAELIDALMVSLQGLGLTRNQSKAKALTTHRAVPGLPCRSGWGKPNRANGWGYMLNVNDKAYRQNDLDNCLQAAARVFDANLLGFVCAKFVPIIYAFSKKSIHLPLSNWKNESKR